MMMCRDRPVAYGVRNALTGTMDGRQQRNALTAAEQAIRALSVGDAMRARSNADKATALDQIDLFIDLADAVESAAQEIDSGSGVSDESWDTIAEAVGPGPLGYLIDEVRD